MLSSLRQTSFLFNSFLLKIIRCLVERYPSPPWTQIFPLFLRLWLSLSKSGPMRNNYGKKLCLCLRDNLVFSQWNERQQGHLLYKQGSNTWTRQRILKCCRNLGAWKSPMRNFTIGKQIIFFEYFPNEKVLIRKIMFWAMPLQ